MSEKRSGSKPESEDPKTSIEYRRNHTCLGYPDEIGNKMQKKEEKNLKRQSERTAPDKTSPRTAEERGSKPKIQKEKKRRKTIKILYQKQKRKILSNKKKRWRDKQTIVTTKGHQVKWSSMDSNLTFIRFGRQQNTRTESTHSSAKKEESELVVNFQFLDRLAGRSILSAERILIEATDRRGKSGDSE